jgi:hypothetical protein
MTETKSGKEGKKGGKITVNIRGEVLMQAIYRGRYKGDVWQRDKKGVFA